MCLSANETLHLSLLILSLHLPVNHRDTVVREGFHQFVIAALQVLELKFIVLLDKRENNVYLPTYFYLLAHKTIDALLALYRIMQRMNRFTTGRQFIDDTDMQIAINRHGQGTGNRSRRHNQDMRRTDIFGP